MTHTMMSYKYASEILVATLQCAWYKKWRSTLKGSFNTQIEEHITTTIEEIQLAIQQCQQNHVQDITINFSVNRPINGIHTTEGVPILFSDQLNVISKTLQEMHQEHYKQDLAPPSDDKIHTINSDTHSPNIYEIPIYLSPTIHACICQTQASSDEPQKLWWQAYTCMCA